MTKTERPPIEETELDDWDIQFLIRDADELNAIEEPTRTKIYELAEQTSHGFELVDADKERVDELYEDLIGGEVRLHEKIADGGDCGHHDYMETVVIPRGGGVTIAGTGVNGQAGSMKVVCLKCKKAYDVHQA